jgi:hypothetical protein
MMILRGGFSAGAFGWAVVTKLDAEVEEETDEGPVVEEPLGVDSCVRVFPKNELKFDYMVVNKRSWLLNVPSKARCILKRQKKGGVSRLAWLNRESELGAAGLTLPVFFAMPCPLDVVPPARALAFLLRFGMVV